MPASVTHEHASPRRRAASTSSAVRACLVVLVVADDPARSGSTPSAGAQPAQPAGVLRGDDVGLGEQPDEPRRGVLRVADRGRRQHQDACRRVARATPRACRSSRAIPRPAPDAGHLRWRGDRCPVATDASAGTGPAGREPPGTLHVAGTDAAPPGGRAGPRPSPSRAPSRPWACGRACSAPARATGSGAGPGRCSVAVVGGFFRFWHLDQPHELVFDETYYVKQAAPTSRSGTSSPGAGKNADHLFTKGNLNVFQTSPDFVVHPPVGQVDDRGRRVDLRPDQLVRAGGSRRRCVGTLSLLHDRPDRRGGCSGRPCSGTTAALLLAIDGQHSCTAAPASSTSSSCSGPSPASAACSSTATRPAGPAGGRRRRRRRAARPTGSARGSGVRWWRLAGSGLPRAVRRGQVVGRLLPRGVPADERAVGRLRAPAAPACAGGSSRRRPARRPARGRRRPSRSRSRRYLASWTGWFRSTGAYDRQWAVTHPSAPGAGCPRRCAACGTTTPRCGSSTSPCTPRTPTSRTRGRWIVLGRPTDFFYEGSKRGRGRLPRRRGCSRAITPIGNPVVWWGGTIAIAVLLVCWALGRDWRAGAVLAGLAAGLAAVVPLPGPHDLHLLRGRLRAVGGAGSHLLPGAAAGAADGRAASGACTAASPRAPSW